MINIPFFVEILFGISTSFFLLAMYIILPPFTEIIRLGFELSLILKERLINLIGTANKRIKEGYSVMSIAHFNFGHGTSGIERRRINLSRNRYKAYAKY